MSWLRKSSESVLLSVITLPDTYGAIHSLSAPLPTAQSAYLQSGAIGYGYVYRR